MTFIYWRENIGSVRYGTSIPISRSLHICLFSCLLIEYIIPPTKLFCMLLSVRSNIFDLRMHVYNCAQILPIIKSLECYQPFFRLMKRKDRHTFLLSPTPLFFRSDIAHSAKYTIAEKFLIMT